MRTFRVQIKPVWRDIFMWFFFVVFIVYDVCVQLSTDTANVSWKLLPVFSTLSLFLRGYGLFSCSMRTENLLFPFGRQQEQ